MRTPTLAVVAAALCIGGIVTLLWKQLDAEPPDGIHEGVPASSLAEREPAVSIAAPLPSVEPVVERGTGVPETVLAANDQNGDGVVTKAEAEVANKSLFQMWNLYDSNKDG